MQLSRLHVQPFTVFVRFAQIHMQRLGVHKPPQPEDYFQISNKIQLGHQEMRWQPSQVRFSLDSVAMKQMLLTCNNKDNHLKVLAWKKSKIKETNHNLILIFLYSKHHLH